jgi:glutamate-ammonia-ligase adenylyltransferase
MLLPGSDGHGCAVPDAASDVSCGGDSFARLSAAAPALACAIGNDPRILDEAADRALPATANSGEHLQAWYDICRRGRHRIAARLLLGELNAAEAARACSDLVDAALSDIMRVCAADFVATHGRVRKGRHAVVAIGRLGARELTSNSDLDLLLLYDYHGHAAMSDGPQSLPASQYYVRLAQRLIAALSANFGEGPLFAVDFRLRPWGRKGPIATRIASLRDYFAAEAWTFEAMALTRARVVAASPGFDAEAETALRAAIVAVGERANVRADAAAMRRMVQREKASRRVFDIKCVAGGLMDIDFVVHALALEHVAAFDGVPMHDMSIAIRTLAAIGALSRADAAVLGSAHGLYQTVIQHLRIVLPAPHNARAMPDAFAALLARASGCADIGELERRLRAAQRAVRQVFERVLGKPQRACGEREAA